jgi:hypothetical protein
MLDYDGQYDFDEEGQPTDDPGYLNNYQCPNRECNASGDQGIEVTGERQESDTVAEWDYSGEDEPELVDRTYYFTAKLGKCRACGLKVRWGDTSSYDGWLPLR